MDRSRVSFFILIDYLSHISFSHSSTFKVFFNELHLYTILSFI